MYTWVKQFYTINILLDNVLKLDLNFERNIFIIALDLKKIMTTSNFINK